ncbi:MAG: hypothetical protein COZ34_03370 [Candidatus Pacebacteria bacterium CG_4_10_14_3_um_filter_34_15]|nr:hypothetical protein [Candidatus Pacearchaeota archaeon]NCQ65371.1 hypothetical protein [Candidatus Paceibacterota bacterium]OIO44245.1 MAG: hypothetical protein AUJ41_03635 [Candidatus Pacebacteria bacterium CG1_02_43_31]PIQ80755.1 MAG: hypothetical protein COV78_03610 [Candidatus Pacebacteria bacterium CG11_big_fil_rev_8_21_14_0_20_34_55]PIX81421.1 MAG: hypothetical protein COZ34_03370 [Candidatus Pacebacteria bacterium CG_4_10_14_3_um_filter_34_15]PJC43905.1 MAG: hypothetical protein CO0
MSERSKRMIEEYLKNIDELDQDLAVREIAATRLWETGDSKNQAIAEEIWKLLGTSEEEVEELKRNYVPKK